MWQLLLELVEKGGGGNVFYDILQIFHGSLSWVVIVTLLSLSDLQQKREALPQTHYVELVLVVDNLRVSVVVFFLIMSTFKKNKERNSEQVIIWTNVTLFVSSTS